MSGDIEELKRLREAEDDQTIEEMIAADSFEEFTIEKVEPYKDESNGFSVTFDGSIGTGLKMPEGKEVKVGDTLRLYPDGMLGSQRHGFAINGEVIEWKTPWERFAERINWLADYDRRKREDFAAARAELDRKYDALPAPLQARMDRLRKEPGFRLGEAYEMSAVWDAPKIADALRPEVEAGGDPKKVVENFRELPYEEQQEKVPNLDPGHSGNTFGGATMLAYRLLAGLEC